MPSESRRHLSCRLHDQTQLLVFRPTLLGNPVSIPPPSSSPYAAVFSSKKLIPTVSDLFVARRDDYQHNNTHTTHRSTPLSHTALPPAARSQHKLWARRKFTIPHNSNPQKDEKNATTKNTALGQYVPHFARRSCLNPSTRQHYAHTICGALCASRGSRSARLESQDIGDFSFLHCFWLKPLKRTPWFF